MGLSFVFVNFLMSVVFRQVVTLYHRLTNLTQTHVSDCNVFYSNTVNTRTLSAHLTVTTGNFR